MKLAPFLAVSAVVNSAGLAQLSHEPDVILLRLRQPGIVRIENGTLQNSSVELRSVFSRFPFVQSRKLSHVDEATDGWYRVQFMSNSPLDSICSALEKCPDVRTASLNKSGIFADAPNDNYWNDQWALHKIKMEQAWDVVKPSNAVLVGIIDSGLDNVHEDLSANVWNNPLETPGDSIDNDGNNRIDDMWGWDFTDNDNNPQEPGSESHGTRSAGVIGARTYNAIGIAGIAGGWQGQGGVRLISLKIGDNTGRWYEARAKEAIDYVTQLRQQHGYHIVVNMSFQTSGVGDEPMPMLEASINAANNAGVVLIAAGGNTIDNPHSPYYGDPEVSMLPIPARYPGVIAVGASQDGETIEEEARSSYSLYVSEAEVKNVLLVAPVDGYSRDVYTTYPGNGYVDWFNGTSAACPIVVGVVSLLLSVNPSLTKPQISTILAATAVKIGSYQYVGGKTDEVGYGRIDAYEAVKYTLEHYGGTLDHDLTIPAGETWTFSPGVTLKFAGAVNLIIYGNVQMVGTLSQPITLTALSGVSPGSWGSITMSGSGASNSSISHVNILYGTKFAVLNNASNVTIQNCEITAVAQGIDFNGSSGSVLNNEITSSTAYHGIVVENGSNVTCNENVLIKQAPNYQSGAAILYAYGSGGTIWKNDISGWNWGVGAIWNSSPHFMSTSNDWVNNRIVSCKYGVRATNSSWPVICPDLAYEFYYYAGNSIHNNSPYNLFFASGGTLWATLTYWGGTPPINFYTLYGSTINYDDWLTSDPWEGEGYQSLAMTNSSSLTPSALPSSQGNVPGEASLFDGVALRLAGKYVEAVDFFKSYLSKNPEDQAAYVELYNCYSKETADDLLPYFSSLPQEASRDHGLLLGYLYLRQGDSRMARQANDELIKSYPNTALASRAKLNNAYLSLYADNDVATAASLLNEVASRPELTTEIELSLVKQAIEAQTAVLGGARSEAQEAVSPIEMQPTETELLQNYPNPFNPATVIKYSVSEPQLVTLKVYDLLGRQISVLVNEMKQPGDYTVEFDASRLPTGVYFYHLTAGKQSIVKRMSFVK